MIRVGLIGHAPLILKNVRGFDCKPVWLHKPSSKYQIFELHHLGCLWPVDPLWRVKPIVIQSGSIPASKNSSTWSPKGLNESDMEIIKNANQMMMMMMMMRRRRRRRRMMRMMVMMVMMPCSFAPTGMDDVFWNHHKRNFEKYDARWSYLLNPLEKNHLCSQRKSLHMKDKFGNPNGFKGSTWARDLHLEGFFVDGISSREIQAFIELLCEKISEVFPPKAATTSTFLQDLKKTKNTHLMYSICLVVAEGIILCTARLWPQQSCLVVEPTPWNWIISPGVNIKNACETTLDKIDPITLGSGLILDLCQSFGDATSWKMDSWIPNGQCPAGFEAIFSLCVFMTWTDMDRNTRFESRNHLGTSQASGFPASVFGSTGFKRSARRSL